MASLLRSQVSGKRHRYVDAEFNLDFTFITDRVMGMSFPADSKWEKLYRNDIDTVAKYFDGRHRDHYKIYNMSNRAVKDSKFKTGSVLSYSWADHHSPALSLLFESCNDMFAFLKDD